MGSRSVALLTVFSLAAFVPGSVHAQDVQGFFLDGEEEFIPMGGNPLSLFNSDVQCEGFIPGSLSRCVSFNFHEDNVFRELHADGTENLLQRFSREVNVSLPLSESPYSPGFRLNVSSVSSMGLVNQSPSELANYQGESKAATLYFQMPLGPALRVGASVGRSLAAGPRSLSYESRFSFLFQNGVLVNVDVGRWNTSQTLQIQYDDGDGILPLDFVSQGARISVSAPVGALTMVLSGHKNFLSSIPDAVDQFDTRFCPNGNDAGLRLDILGFLSAGWKTLLTANEEATLGSGSFYSEERKYGSLNGFDLRTVTLQAAIEKKGLSGDIFESDLKWKLLRGKVDGFAEDWPFTSLFDSPIPVRENISASGSLNVLQLHAGWLKPIRERVRFGIGASLLCMKPQLELDSWESKYLVFGVRGYKERFLTVDVVDAALISTGLQVDLSPFSLDYAFTQFVPLYVGRTNVNGTSGISGPAAGTSRSSGGQFHSVGIKYEF